LLALLLFSSGATHLFAQNLVPNPDFEFYLTCPVLNNDSGPMECAPWIDGNDATSDYYNACAGSGGASVPVNDVGYQEAISGVGYAAIAVYSANVTNYREYLQVPLVEPLVADEWYYFSMYANVADNWCGCNRLGAYISTVPPVPAALLIEVDPQIDHLFGLILDSVAWTLIEGCFQASGGEQFLTIGNFHHDSETFIDPDCNEEGFLAGYFLIEDVLLMSTSAPDLITVDLGGPVTACYSYTIDPEISGVNYIWSDGSHGPTLTVTESGTYSLTVVDGCIMGDDEIEVEILGTDPPVDVGPDEHIMCEGESFTISLDPDAGDYEWNIGSSSSTLTIIESGIYAVTLNDDDCDNTSDQIQVIVVSPPAPFTLGDDVILCPGDEIEYNFDPGLGNFMWNDGSTFSFYDISAAGTYSLSISNMCGIETDEIEVTQLVPPNPNVVPQEVILCSNEPVEIILDPDAGNYTWEDGSTASTYTIETAGTYLVSISNVCGEVQAEILALAAEDPEVELGNNITLCAAAFPVMLDPEAQYATAYAWQDGSTDSTFIALAAGVYSVTVSNFCGSANDQVIIIQENGTPQPMLPADQLLCPGQTFLLTNSGTTGAMLWQDGSTADTLLVAAPGTYVLTVTTLCGSGSDTTSVQYVSTLAIPDLGPDLSLCQGEDVVLQVNTTGVQYLWQDGSMADTLLVNQAGTYAVQISNQCSIASDTVIVSLNNDPPQVDLPTQLSLCLGTTLTLDAGLIGVSYLWSDGSQQDSLIVNTPGTYSLTVSNSCGVAADTVIVLDGGALPVVELGAAVSLCIGDSLLIMPSSANADTWLWQDGSIDSIYTITTESFLVVQVTNACGIAFDTLAVTFLPLTPPLDLGVDTAICPGTDVLLTIAIPDVVILWNDGSTGSSLLINTTGQYSASISNGCGVVADTIGVSLLPPAPVLHLGNDQSLCPGEVITLAPAIEDVMFVWQDGSTGSTFEATQPGVYYLTVLNACGSDSDTVTIIESTEGPVVNIGPDILACEGESVTIVADISGVDYLWQDGSTLSSYTTSIPGTFILQVTNNCGIDRDTVVVEINGTPPATELGPDTTLCEGATLILEAEMHEPGTTVQWQDGSTLPTYNVTSSGLYFLMESNHCGEHADTISVSFESAPSPFNLGIDTVICPGEVIVLQAPNTALDIQWQDGSNDTLFVASATQVYSLTITNDCGEAYDEINIEIETRQPESVLYPEVTRCPGEEIELDASQSVPVSYLWNTGETSPSISVSDSGTYSVLISALCTQLVDQSHVASHDSCFDTNLFYIPNVFSPNGDGINDIFSITFEDPSLVERIDVSIYDRWGNLIHTSRDHLFEWDGTFEGEPMMPGVYVFRAEIEFVDPALNPLVILHGDVTLVR
jgi:gliding motility-associated-like protein